MTSEVRKIGFIGLGSMGGDQARELAKLPLPLTVYDVAPGAMAPFEGKAVLAGDVAEVGHDADVVGICVQDDAQVHDCADRLLPAMKAGSVLMIHSTVKPATMTTIGAQARALGIAVLDASVSRTEIGQDGPFVFCMTGGDEAVAARVKGVIDAFATDTLHIGPLGSAMALKICNNLASWCAIMTGLEAVSLAEAAGVPLDKLVTVMKRNGVLTPPAQSFVARRADPGDDEQRIMMKVLAGIGEKDLRLAEALADGAHSDAPIASFIRNTIREKIVAISER